MNFLLKNHLAYINRLANISNMQELCVKTIMEYRTICQQLKASAFKCLIT